mgnify:CR=1 FL=1|jgi:hypothetical protein
MDVLWVYSEQSPYIYIYIYITPKCYWISVTHLSNKLITRSILLQRRIDRESACLMVRASSHNQELLVSATVLKHTDILNPRLVPSLVRRGADQVQFRPDP